MGLAASPATEAIIESLPLAKQGVASATNDVARELRGALGIAVIGSTFTTAYRSAVLGSSVLHGLPAASFAAVKASPAAGMDVAAHAGPQGGALVRAVQDSFASGFGVAMWVAASTFAIGAVTVWLRSPVRVPDLAEDLELELVGD